MLTVLVILSNHEEITYEGVLDVSVSGNRDHLRIHYGFTHYDYDMSEVEYFEIKCK